MAVSGQDIPFGFIVVDLIDGRAHIEQVSVHPDHARGGVGRMLINHVDRWAAGQGIDALTLATFRTVPWNGPYYERLGFRYLTAGEETAGLRAVRERERALGLEVWPRTSMRRTLA